MLNGTRAPGYITLLPSPRVAPVELQTPTAQLRPSSQPGNLQGGADSCKRRAAYPSSCTRFARRAALVQAPQTRTDITATDAPYSSTTARGCAHTCTPTGAHACSPKTD